MNSEQNEENPRTLHYKDGRDTKDVKHGGIPPSAKHLHFPFNYTKETQCSDHEKRNMEKSVVFPYTVGYGFRMTASSLAKLLPAIEEVHDEENSLDNHEIGNTNIEQTIESGSYESKIVDDPRNGAKSLEKDLTVPNSKILYKLQDKAEVNDSDSDNVIIMEKEANNPVISHGSDNIRKEEGYEEAFEQQNPTDS